MLVVGGDESRTSRQPEHQQQLSQRIGAGGRIGLVIGVITVFVLGVIVGRTGTLTHSVGGSPASSASTRASLPSNSTTTADRSSARPRVTPARGSTESPGAEPHVLNPALTSAIRLPILGQSDVQSMAVVENHLVALTPGWLVRMSWDRAGSLYSDGKFAVSLPLGDPNHGNWELLSDGTALWAVSVGAKGRVYRISTTTLRPFREWNLPAQSESISSAAALDGHLYLNTEDGVYDVAPSTLQDGQLPVVADAGRSMIADPSRHRLLLLNHDNNGWIVDEFTPSEPKTVVGISLRFDAQSLAVAGDTIWVTGATSGANPRPILAQLDPTTLQVVGHRTLDDSLPPVPTVVAHGNSLWVRSKDSDSQLWCINPHSGAVAHHWSAIPGILAADAGQVFVADGNVVGHINASACTN